MEQEEASNVSDTPLSDAERQLALRVLRSQGRAVGCLDSLPVAMQRAIAAFCDAEGNVRPSAVQGVRELFMNYYHDLKAEVDDGSG